MKRSKIPILCMIALLVSMTISFAQSPENPPLPEHEALFIPVEFENLDLNINKEAQVELTWYTASEHNNDYFTVERSAGGHYWDEISVIPGSGSTTIPQKYQFTDYSKITGPLYYKLSQYDYDGHSSQLAVVTTGFADFTNLYGYNLFGAVKQVHNIQYNSTVNLAVVVTDKRTYKLYIPPGF